MKRFLYLTNFEFKRMLKPLLGICIFLIVFQLTLMGVASKDAYNYISYEEFFATSGSTIVFLLSFAAICGLCIMAMISNYFGSKSIYTLMTLPQDRRYFYFAKLASGLTNFTVLISSQLLSVMLGYLFFAPKIQRTLEQAKITGLQVRYDPASNGLFLAFIRSDFFRILFPLSLEGLFGNFMTIR